MLVFISISFFQNCFSWPDVLMVYVAGPNLSLSSPELIPFSSIFLHLSSKQKRTNIIVF
jgi:hypothetical protein